MPRTPLVDPRAYFRSRSDPLLAGTVLVAIHVVLEFTGLYVMIRLVFAQAEGLDSQVEQQVLSMLGSVFVVAVFFAVVGAVLAWFVVAVIMHYGSGGSRTKGSFTDALAVAGWAYAPEVVFFAPSMLYGWWRISELSFDGSDATDLAAEFDAAAAQLEFSIVSIVLFVLVTAWSVYILAYGVSQTHDVPVDTTVAPALIVAGGSALLFLLA